MENCKRTSGTGMFKPGCKGPWMVMQEYVLLGLALSHNYVVKHTIMTWFITDSPGSLRWEKHQFKPLFQILGGSNKTSSSFMPDHETLLPKQCFLSHVALPTMKLRLFPDFP